METLTLKSKIKRTILPIIRSRGQTSFALQLPASARLLDVGCGDSAPLRIKTVRPDLYYVGLDIDARNQTDTVKFVANEYHLTRPATFHETIRALALREFDAVICSHNIEHTYKPFQVLEAICSVLRPEGQLYLAFPSEKTLRLPHRQGTLNFYDDETHIWLPRFDEIVACLRQNGVQPVYQVREYHPVIDFLLGAVTEPYSAFTRKVGPLGGTWALYGFESIIWGRRTA